MKTILFLGTTFFFFLLNPAVQAAQDAVVVTDQTPVLNAPQESSKQIATLKNGQKIRISSFPKNGWYKVLVPENAQENSPKNGTLKYGWILQSHLALATSDSNVKSADLEFKNQNEHPRRDLKENRFFIKIGGMYDIFFPTDISKSLGKSSGEMFGGLGGFAEASVRLDSNTKAAFRVGTYSFSKTIQYSDQNYYVSLSGIPILLGLERLTFQSPSFDFSVAVYAGVGLNNSAQVRNDFPEPNGFKMTSTFFATQINTVTRYWFSKNFSLNGELGFYYSRIPETKISTPFNGDSPFRENADTLKTLLINHLGPYLALGLEYGF